MKKNKIALMIIVALCINSTFITAAVRQSSSQSSSSTQISSNRQNLGTNQDGQGEHFFKAISLNSKNAPDLTITLATNEKGGSKSTSTMSGGGISNVSADKINDFRLTIKKGQQGILDSKISLADWEKEHSSIIEKIKTQLENKGIEVNMEQDPSNKEKILIEITKQEKNKE